MLVGSDYQIGGKSEVAANQGPLPPLSLLKSLLCIQVEVQAHEKEMSPIWISLPLT